MHASTTLDRPAAAYDAMAAWYDAYTDFPAFFDWVRGLEELARAHGVRGRRLLDAGCGTGKTLTPLLERGYEAVGVDASAGMLARAEAKLAGRARLVHADLADLPDTVDGPFDLVTCLNDVANCIHDPADLARVLASLGERLAPGGVLVFDTSLIRAYRTTFATTHRREWPGRVFTWIGETSPDLPEGGTAAATLELFAALDEDAPDGGCWRRETSRHVQRHHPHHEVVAALEAADLELVALLGDDDGVRDGSAPDPARHFKAIHVVRRRGDAG